VCFELLKTRPALRLAARRRWQAGPPPPRPPAARTVTTGRPRHAPTSQEPQSAVVRPYPTLGALSQSYAPPASSERVLKRCWTPAGASPGRPSRRVVAQTCRLAAKELSHPAAHSN